MRFSPNICVLAAWLLASCGSADSFPSFSPNGSLHVQLRAQVGDVTYRLREAELIVTGATSGEDLLLSSEDAPDTAWLRRELPVGSYEIELLDGWRLERRVPRTDDFETIAAQLASLARQSFEINPGDETRVVYDFIVQSDEDDEGTLTLSIGVEDPELCEVRGELVPRDDGEPCTVDVCEGDAGVSHEPAPEGTACDDSNPCTGAGACDGNGECVEGAPLELPNLGACGSAACDPATGSVRFVPYPLDDDNPCTTDYCDARLGVVHEAAPDGTRCSDGDICNSEEYCEAGACIRDPAFTIDDGNPCTLDECNPNADPPITHGPEFPGFDCSDDNLCNGKEICAAGGVCSSGTPINVDDGDPCTHDTCDPSTGEVRHELILGCKPECENAPARPFVYTLSTQTNPQLPDLGWDPVVLVHPAVGEKGGNFTYDRVPDDDLRILNQSPPNLLVSPRQADPRIVPQVVHDARIEGYLHAPRTGGLVGVAFAFQDRGRFFLFDWASTATSLMTPGMRLKVVETGEDATFDIDDFRVTSSRHSERVEMVRDIHGAVCENDVVRERDVVYRFDLELISGGLRLRVSPQDDESNVLEDWRVDDPRIQPGRVGFLSFSNERTNYRKFQMTELEPGCASFTVVDASSL